MKKVLVISYYWPPSGGSGVQRWVKMCRYLPEFGWEPLVYTPSNPALTSTDESLCAEVSGIQVIRRPIFEPGQFARRSTSAQVTPINAQNKTFAQKVAMWIRGNCFIPDPRVLWVRPSVRYLKKYLKEHPVDAIVSTGPPHSMHLIARSLSRHFGLPWVADFRDPWTKMFYFKHLQLGAPARQLHLRLEKKVLDDCSRVVAVSPLVREDFRAMTSTPVELITNGFDTVDFPEEDSYSSIFTIVHAGLFAADGNPECVWKALKTLHDRISSPKPFRLLLCGKTDKAVLDSIAAAGLGDCTEDLGYRPHSEVVHIMRKASVLLLPLRKEPEYRATLPGKLFEYLASRRPVLGIGQTDGAMASILSSTQAGATFGWEDEAGVYKWLSDSYDKWSEGNLADNVADLSAYTRRRLALSYAGLLDSLVTGKKHCK